MAPISVVYVQLTAGCMCTKLLIVAPAALALWTSTCSGSKGNMGASVAQIKALFVNQVPDFDAITLSLKEVASV